MSLFPKKEAVRERRWVRIALWTLLFFLIFCVLWLGIATLYYMKHYGKLDVHLFRLQMSAQEKTTTLIPKANKDALEPKSDEVHLYASEHRVYAPYADFPQSLIDAFVAIEDKRYFSHHGVDWKRTIGATLGFLSGRDRYGGSTITQQLIKNGTGEAEPSPARKLKEISRALQLEKNFSKEQILELYLNTVYLSGHCYGVQTASEYYFGCDVSNLTPAQCASLAAIIQAPTKWDPIRNPDAHTERRNLVLLQMKENGFLSEDAYQDAVNTPLVTVGKEEKIAQILSWYQENAVDEAVSILQEIYELDEKSARRFLYTGGFTVETAQNTEVQRTLEAVYENPDSFARVDHSLIQPQSSAVVLDPHTGAILGLVGARGEKKENRILNYATQTRRPPGSALKPLSVYAPALQAGLIHYATVYDDTPYDFTTKASGWPSNYPNVYAGLTTVHDALRRSVNTVAVKVLNDYGIEKSFDFLQNRVHLSSLIYGKKDANGNLLTDCALAPLALGQLTYGVSVLELTAGYTVFANGNYLAPHAVLRITDAMGNEIYSHKTAPEAVLSEGNAQVMTQMLREVTQSGTASAITLKNKVDTAGKTGTTTDDCDRWFVGYTKDYLCGVWFGYATPQPLTGFSETASPALRLWDAIMTPLSQNAIEKGDRRIFDTSQLVRTSYCKDSGKLTTASCLRDARGHRTESGYFTLEQIPSAFCDSHIDVLYDTQNGGVAFGACPSANLSLVGLIRTPKRAFPLDLAVTDAQYVYCSLPHGTAPCQDSSKAFFADSLPPGTYCGHSHTDHPVNRACLCRQEITLPPLQDVPPLSHPFAKRKKESEFPKPFLF